MPGGEVARLRRLQVQVWAVESALPFEKESVNIEIGWAPVNGPSVTEKVLGRRGYLVPASDLHSNLSYVPVSCVVR